MCVGGGEGGVNREQGETAVHGFPRICTVNKIDNNASSHLKSRFPIGILVLTIRSPGGLITNLTFNQASTVIDTSFQFALFISLLCFLIIGTFPQFNYMFHSTKNAGTKKFCNVAFLIYHG